MWSIYRKMASRNIDFEQVYDILAFVFGSNGSPVLRGLGPCPSSLKPAIQGFYRDAKNQSASHCTPQ